MRNCFAARTITMVAGVVLAASILGSVWEALGVNQSMLRYLYLTAAANTGRPAQALTLAAQLGTGPLAHENRPGRWAGSRQAATSRLDERALASLQPIALDCRGNDLLKAHYVETLSRMRRDEELLAFDQDCGPLPAFAVFRETVALANLRKSRELLAEGSGELALPLLRQAALLNSGDLYANYHLWKQSLHHDTPELKVDPDVIRRFAASTLASTHTELADYSAQVVPDLLTTGLWDQPLTSRVVSLLVLKYPDRASVQHMVQELMRREPEQAMWWQWQAEMDQRLTLLPRAVLERETETGLDSWQQPLESQRAQVCQSHPDRLSQDRALISQQAGLPANSINLGQNLLPNGGMEEWSDETPQEWVIIDHSIGDEWWNHGAFVAGRDELCSYEGSTSAVVFGLWADRDTKRSPAQVGFWAAGPLGTGLATLRLEPGRAYWVGFAYQTESTAKAAIAVSLQLALPPDRLAYPVYFPPTDGDWRRAGVIVCVSRAESRAITPMINSLTLGRVRFDDVGVWEIMQPVDTGCYEGK